MTIGQTNFGLFWVSHFGPNQSTNLGHDDESFFPLDYQGICETFIFTFLLQNEENYAWYINKCISIYKIIHINSYIRSLLFRF